MPSFLGLLALLVFSDHAYLNLLPDRSLPPPIFTNALRLRAKGVEYNALPIPQQQRISLESVLESRISKLRLRQRERLVEMPWHVAA